MLKYFVVSSLGLIANTAPIFEQLTRFEGLANDGGTAESCIYDPIKGLWRFFDRNMDGESASLPSTYPYVSLGKTGTDSGFYQGRGRGIMGNQTSSSAAGMAFVQDDDGNFIYIADIGNEGEIFKYNVDTEELETSLYPGKPGTNGLCYDSDNNLLYAANVGIDFFGTGLPIVNTSNVVVFNLETSTKKYIYLSGDILKDQNGDIVKENDTVYRNITGNNYTFRPNGCTVKDGMVYFVETRTNDFAGYLGIYDGEEFMINTQLISVSGDGIITLGDYLIASSWATSGLLYYDLNQYPNGTFITWGSMTSPADIGADPYGTICIPSLQTGYIYFAKFSVDGFGYNLLQTEFDFEDISSQQYAKSRAISYDPNNQRFAFVNALETSYIADIDKIDANSVLNASVEDFGWSGISDAVDETTTVIPDQGYDAEYDEAFSPFWFSLITVGDYFYMADANGLVAQTQINSENIINYQIVVPGGLDYGASGLRQLYGLCYDPDDETMIYAVNQAGYIFSIDVSTDQVASWEVIQIYNASEIYDENGDNPRVFVPRDCTIYDGKMYLIEYNTNAFGIFDIKQNTFKYNTNVFKEGVTPIRLENRNDLFVTATTGSDGLILVSRISNGELAPFQVVANPPYYIWDIAIDYINGIIAVTSESVDTYSGFITFIVSDELINDKQEKGETASTTMEPLDQETTTEITTSTSISIVTTEDANKSNHVSLIVTFTIIFAASLFLMYH